MTPSLHADGAPGSREDREAAIEHVERTTRLKTSGYVHEAVSRDRIVEIVSTRGFEEQVLHFVIARALERGDLVQVDDKIAHRSTVDVCDCCGSANGPKAYRCHSCGRELDVDVTTEGIQG